MKMPTGIRRLDELLGGGVPERSTTLLYGPPFMGKDVLSRQFLVSGMRQGVPGIMVLTDISAAEARQLLTAVDPKYPDYEKAGLAHFIDTYSKSIGAAESHANVEYLDGLLNFNAVNLAVNNAERKIIREHPGHRLVFDSVSTLMTYTNAPTAFRFLQVLVGKTKVAGATGLLLMEAGMHPDPDVQMIKHLTDGVVELRNERGKSLLHVEGVGVTESPGWVEYRFSPQQVEITGSFAAGRIR